MVLGGVSEGNKHHFTTFQEDIQRVLSKPVVHDEAPKLEESQPSPLKVYPSFVPEILSPPPLDTILKEMHSPAKKSEWMEDIDEIVLNNLE
jgi:hypothetical protein